MLVDPDRDQSPRWWPGRRLHHLFEDVVDRLVAGGEAHHLAVDGDDVSLTYAQLDADANRLARYLVEVADVRPGERVALLTSRAVDSYRAMLAVSKAHAAYVPLDVSSPAHRLELIVADADCRTIITTGGLADLAASTGARVVDLDAQAEAIAARSSTRPPVEDPASDDPDALAYVIYTSGSSGRPKGVAVGQRSICNFVEVAAEVYGIEGDDRLYQGLTIAFDFSVEEIWVPWRCGATLVPRPAGGPLLGPDLHRFLEEGRVSAMCCVPTLLATIEDDLPGLRFLLVSGEACPQGLALRWSHPGRRFLNVYGPTEATVTATWTVLEPDRPVTIGRPLPTYSCAVVDQATGQPVPVGEPGELVVAGVGVALGYLNRPDAEARAFVPDTLGMPNNPGGRIYRTGDLVRVNEQKQIEYLGRIDQQVKLRGYRIELTEIESVMLETAGVAQAVVSTYEPAPGKVELAAFYSVRTNATVDRAAMLAHLRSRLPAYMVPAWLDELAIIPLTANDKADRGALPRPTLRAGAHSDAGAPGTVEADLSIGPTTPTEDLLATHLAELMGGGSIPVRAHLFDDLGADSLMMAQLCAAVRRQDQLPEPPSMRDIYLNPTIAGLAAVLDQRAAELEWNMPSARLPATGDGPSPAPARSLLRYRVVGAAQLAVLFAGVWLTTLSGSLIFRYVEGGTGVLGIYARAVVGTAAAFAGLTVLPVIAKWLLVGRFRPGTVPLWSSGHLRFWIVARLIRLSPLGRLPASPLQVLYLRALGARIGRGTLLLGRQVPVCPDLFSVGDCTVVRQDVQAPCYRAEVGQLRFGSVTLGSHVVVGEASVLDIDSGMGNGSTLSHASTLQRGQFVPEGQAWHGTPARPVDRPAAGRIDAPANRPPWRAVGYGTWQLLWIVAGWGAIATALSVTVVDALLFGPTGGDAFAVLNGGSAERPSWGVAAVEIVLLGAIVYLLRQLVQLAVVFTVPRLLSLGTVPGVRYPVYGVRFALIRAVTRLSNVRFHMLLFGDSALITGYLRALGWQLGRVLQTGSNFGVAQRADNPYHVHVGRGTMIADGLSATDVMYSASSVWIAPVWIGRQSFLGNAIAFPPGARTGDDVLYATKVAVPVDGPMRYGVGLLGSPAFEIPRSVLRDAEAKRASEHVPPDHLRRKTRHNLGSIGFLLLLGWMRSTILMGAVIAASSVEALDPTTRVALALAGAGSMQLAVSMLAEVAARRFQPLQPLFCSVYDRAFWRHERYWKLGLEAFLPVFAGTPLRPAILRVLGLQVGRCVFDDGCGIPERTLVTIGDGTSLGAGATIQAHSLEDGAFKSDRIVVGSDVTIGVGAFVHYGSRIGDGAILEANSFLMKGEEMPPGSRWGGNPAQDQHPPSVERRQRQRLRSLSQG